MDPPRNPRDQPEDDRLSASTLHDLRGPLTIIKGQAQLLERWVRRNDLPDADAVLFRLIIIERMVSDLAGNLDKVSQNPGKRTDGDRSKRTP